MEQVWALAAGGGALREGNSAQLAPVAAATATAEPNKSAMASFTRDLASA
jgi:1-deoxy-D-xylulose 5-phosphate reductoisomerase